MKNVNGKTTLSLGQRNTALPILAAAGGNILWGFSILFSRLALQVASPNTLLSVRFLIGVTIMTGMLLLGKASFSFKGKNPVPLLLLALSELLYFCFENYGILYTNATFAGVVLSVVPVVALIMAAVFLKEYPTKKQTVFCFLPIAGVIIITVSGSSMGIIQPQGVFFLVCSCLMSAAYKTVNRRAAVWFSPFERTYFSLCIMAAVFTFLALQGSGWNAAVWLAPVTNPQFILPVLMLSISCSVMANMMVNYASGKMSVVKVSVFGALSTICSAFAGIVFLGEPVTWVSFAGTVLIIVGIWFVTKEQK